MDWRKAGVPKQKERGSLIAASRVGLPLGHTYDHTRTSKPIISKVQTSLQPDSTLEGEV